MTPLPDCPHCDAADTLEPVGVEPNGVKVCLCGCCSKRCRVNAQGAVVWRPDMRDAQGVVMYDP